MYNEFVKRWYKEGRKEGKLWMIIINDNIVGTYYRDFFPSDHYPDVSLEDIISIHNKKEYGIDMFVSEIYSLEFPLKEKDDIT